MSKKTPAKKEDRRFGVWWVCPNCEGNPEFDHEPMMKHLQEVHGINTKGAKGIKRPQCHLDGDDWFSWTYEWEINGLRLIQHSCQKRKPAWERR